MRVELIMRPSRRPVQRRVPPSARDPTFAGRCPPADPGLSVVVGCRATRTVTPLTPISLADGSRQQDLWGINLCPDLAEADWLEFDSMINLRPSLGNRSRSVDDPSARERINEIIRSLVRR